MRHTTIALLLGCMCFLQLAAQNWQPFTLGESAHYASDTSTFPDRTVRIDSATGPASDSIWDFNNQWEQVSWNAAYIDGANLGGRRMKLHGNGHFQFLDPGNLALYTWAQVGDSWLMDSVQMDTATLVRIDTDSVLGQLDSIKVIAVGGDTMRLSQAHGITEWPALLGGTHFKLVGIQERHLGDTLPGFDGFIRYKVGDEYYWEADYARVDHPMGEFHHWQTKMEITAAVRDSAGLHLNMHVAQRVYSQGSQIGFGSSYTWHWDIADLPDALARKSNHEPVFFPNILTPYVPNVWFPMEVNGDGYNFTQADYAWTRADYYLVNDTMKLRLGPDNGWITAIYQGAALACCNQSAELTAGLGITSQRSRGFETETWYRLVGHIIDGDTVGTIWTESFLLGEEAERPSFAWQLFPNPAQAQFQVQFGNAAGASVHITDLMGRMLKSEDDVVNGATIDIADLPAGIYEVVLTVGNASDVKMLRVLR